MFLDTDERRKMEGKTGESLDHDFRIRKARLDKME